MGVTLWSALALITVALVFLAFFFLFGKAFALWMRSYLIKKQKEYMTIDISKSTIDFAGRVVFLLVFTVGIILALIISNVVTEMGWLIGALGLAVGVSLKGFLNNYVAGMSLLVQEKTKVGSVVAISGVRGKIREIGLRYTLIRSFDGLEILVPNRSFFEEVVTVYNGGPTRRIHIPLTLREKTDLKLATETVLELLRQQEGVLQDHPVGVFVTSFEESGVRVEIRYWVATASSWVTGRSEIMKQIKTTFDAKQIELTPVGHERFIDLSSLSPQPVQG